MVCISREGVRGEAATTGTVMIKLAGFCCFNTLAIVPITTRHPPVLLNDPAIWSRRAQTCNNFLSSIGVSENSAFGGHSKL